MTVILRAPGVRKMLHWPQDRAIKDLERKAKDMEGKIKDLFNENTKLKSSLGDAATSGSSRAPAGSSGPKLDLVFAVMVCPPLKVDVAG